MIRFKNFSIGIFGLGMIVAIVVGYQLRIADYAVLPFPGESQDEYSYAWVGMSLVELGVPVGISGINGYELNDERYINVDRVYQSTAGGVPMIINRPWFDHPPLFGLVTGGYAYWQGARVFEDAGAFLIRKPVIYLGVLAIGLTGLMGWALGDKWMGLLGSGLLATSPYVVVSSRMGQAENGMLVMWLASMVCLRLFVIRNNERFLWGGAMLAGLGMLFKLSGIVSVVGGLVVLWIHFAKDRRKLIESGLVWVIVSMSWASLFVGYGWVYDGQLFGTILRSNMNRFYGVGPEGLYELMTMTRLTRFKELADAWPLMGWLGLMGLWRRLNDTDQWLGVMVGLYMFIYLWQGSEPYGWYGFPLLPWLMLVVGRVVSLGIRKLKMVEVSCLLLLVPLGLHISRLVDVVEFQHYLGLWKGMLLVILVGVLVKDWDGIKSEWLIRGILISLLVANLAVNVMYGKSLTVEGWY